MSVQTVTFSYYVICQDFGHRGREAIVDPEMTRRGAIDKVRELLSDGKEIAFIHRITMNDPPEDVKEELIAAARFDDNVETIAAVLDQQAARWDHTRDLRKHEVV